jgi:APA family basic amino acid/polyamine antiporter
LKLETTAHADNRELAAGRDVPEQLTALRAGKDRIGHDEQYARSESFRIAAGDWLTSWPNSGAWPGPVRALPWSIPSIVALALREAGHAPHRAPEILMASVLRRRLGVSTALAMIVAEVMGVGIFLTPAGMARTLNTTGWVLAVWALVGLLSAAGAVCYAELGSRYPEAGGEYVFLREAFGARCAFVFGWMSLLVMDPGLTAALSVGLAQYLLVLFGGPASLVPSVAIVAIVAVSGLTLLGVGTSTRVLRWTAAAKLVAIALFVGAVAAQGSGPTTTGAIAHVVPARPAASALAGALMGAFFAFGGWWDLGKMSEEIVEPRRTLPIALIGGIGVVTLVYAAISVAFILAVRGHASASDETLVATLGAAVFGTASARLLAITIVVAVAGSLAAVLLGAPRVYLAMARTGVFPASWVRFHPRRQSAPRATLVQVALACLLVMLGSFDQILGYFIPAAVFFLGLSAATILVLPRPPRDAAVFRAPWHPVPILVFLVLVVVMIAMFAVGRPVQTLIGVIVVALGIPVSWLVVRPASRTDNGVVDAPTVGVDS